MTFALIHLVYTTATDKHTNISTADTPCLDSNYVCSSLLNLNTNCLTSDYVKANCKKSCGTCTTPTPPSSPPSTIAPTTTTTTATPQSLGNSEYFWFWAAPNYNFCETDDYVKQNCKRLCGTCITTEATTTLTTNVPTTAAPPLPCLDNYPACQILRRQ